MMTKSKRCGLFWHISDVQYRSCPFWPSSLAVPVSGSDEAALGGGEILGLPVGTLALPLLPGSAVESGPILWTNSEWVRLMSGRLLLLVRDRELRREKRRTKGLKRWG